MYQDHGPYRMHYYSRPGDCDYIEIRSIPDGWKPILDRKPAMSRYAAPLAAAVAFGAWTLVAVSAVTTFAG